MCLGRSYLLCEGVDVLLQAAAVTHHEAGLFGITGATGASLLSKLTDHGELKREREREKEREREVDGVRNEKLTFHSKSMKVLLD